MKNLLFVNFVFIFIFSSLSQNQYNQGYSDGYPIGYCYYSNMGCIAPITPIAPLPNIGESSNNYLDGYNRGLIDGIKKFNESKISTTYKKSTTNQTTYSTPQNLPEFKPFTPDFNFYQQVLSKKQNEYNIQKNNQTTKITVDPKLDQFLKEQLSPENIELKKQYIKLCKAQYNTFKAFPLTLKDGFYKNVTIISEPPVGQEKPFPNIKENCYVLVQDNKIIMVQEKNVVGNNTWTYSRSYFPSLSSELDEWGEIGSCNSIEKGKTKYKWTLKDGWKYFGADYTGTEYQVYFNDYLTQYNTAQNLLTEIKNKYKAKTSFEKITNGWHTCYLTNKIDFCDVRNVYVENGKIIKWVGRDGTEVIVDSGGEITNCKSTFSKKWPPASNVVTYSNTSLFKSITEIFDVYFIDL